MEGEELSFDDRFKVEEKCPGAGVADEVGSEATVKGGNGVWIVYEGSEESETSLRCRGGTSVD